MSSASRTRSRGTEGVLDLGMVFLLGAILRPKHFCHVEFFLRSTFSSPIEVGLFPSALPHVPVPSAQTSLPQGSGWRPGTGCSTGNGLCANHERGPGLSAREIDPSDSGEGRA